MSHCFQNSDRLSSFFTVFFRTSIYLGKYELLSFSQCTCIHEGTYIYVVKSYTRRLQSWKNMDLDTIEDLLGKFLMYVDLFIFRGWKTTRKLQKQYIWPIFKVCDSSPVNSDVQQNRCRCLKIVITALLTQNLRTIFFKCKQEVVMLFHVSK